MPDEIDAEFESAFTAAESGGDAGDSMGLEDFSSNANVIPGDEWDSQVSEEISDGDTDERVGDDDTDSGTETSETPDAGDNSTEVFDWATHKDDPVIIKVAGEDVQVTLGEALAGYMRQADYTRKNQAIAEERKYADWARDMQRAFQTDPHGTISALQKAFGVDEADDPYADLDPDVAQRLRAQDQQIRQVQSQQQQIEQERILEDIKREIATVRDEFPDFDPEKVLPLAADRGLPIRDAYLILKGQNATQQERAAEQARKQAEEAARRRAQATQANKKVSRGAGLKAGEAKVPQFDSFADMLSWGLDNSE